MGQSNLYKATENVDYLGDFPGAQRERDRLRVMVSEGSVDIEDRVARSLGSVTVDGTPIDDALAATGADHLLVGQADGESFDVEQATPIGVEDSGGTQVDPATEATLATLAAAVNGNDRIEVDVPTVVDISSRDGRNLGSVDVTAMPDQDVVEHDAATLASGGTLTFTLSATGAESLLGTIVSSGTYDLTVSWQTSTGTEIKSESIASGVAAGTATDLDLPARSTNVVVTVTDTSGAEQTVSGVAHLA